MKSGATLVLDRTAKLFEGVEKLTSTRVMVGVPAEKTDRRDEGNSNLTNAALAYIQSNGAPEINLPARPFLAPGIERKKTETVELLKKAGSAALDGNPALVDRILHAVGILNSSSARAVITEGIPPPLAPSTIAGRIRRVKGKKRRDKISAAQAAGTPESTQLGAEGIFTPLIVTSQLLKSITYVLRRIGKR